MRRKSTSDVRCSCQHTRGMYRCLQYIHLLLLTINTGGRGKLRIALISGENSHKLRHLLRTFIEPDDSESDNTDADSDSGSGSSSTVSPSSPAPIPVEGALRSSRRLPRPTRVSAGYPSTESTNTRSSLQDLPRRRVTYAPLPTRMEVSDNYNSGSGESTDVEGSDDDPYANESESSVSPDFNTAGSPRGESSFLARTAQRALSTPPVATSTREPSGSHESSSSSDSSSRTFGPGSVLPPSTRTATPAPLDQCPASRPAASSTDKTSTDPSSNQATESPIEYNVQTPSGRHTVAGWYVPSPSSQHPEF